jgi:hypothetical protein
MDTFSQVVAEVTGALDKAGIRYAIGGSVASGARGIWRNTQDVDVLAAIRPLQVHAFVTALGKDWYADGEMMRSSLLSGRSFNVIHTGLAWKVDIFPVTDEFHFRQLERASIIPIGAAKVPCAVTSAEDILLSKLRWYRDGGQTSTNQWNDVVSLIGTNESLDTDYLNYWAARLGVTDLLAKAQSDAAD